jgi:tetratricopeptide (TPR) repeat protein
VACKFYKNYQESGQPGCFSRKVAFENFGELISRPPGGGVPIGFIYFFYLNTSIMKTMFFSVALLLGTVGVLSAQDFYLPVSAQSETARRAYQNASYLGSNIRFDAARMEIGKAVEAGPGFFMAYAYDYQVLAKDEQKPALLEKALAIDPAGFTEAEKIMRRQLVAWKADPKASPAGAMKALVAAYPKTPEAYEWAYLHAWYTDGNKEAALDYAQKLAALDPNFGPVFNSLGYFYMEKEEMDRAKAAFEKYLELAPAEPNAYDSMGEYYLNTGDFAKSAGYYDQAVALGMEGSKNGAGKAREQQRIYLPVSSTSEAATFDYFKALKAGENANIPDFFDGMKAAVKTDPSFFMVYAHLAFAETAFGQYEKAAAYIKPALAIDPAGFNESEQIHRKALQAWDKDPKADPAKYMEALTAAYPNTAEACDLAGRSAAWLSKDPKASVKYMLRLLELRPEFGGGYNTLGYNYMALKEMDKAKAAFEKYLELAPAEANAYDSMGEYYLNTGDFAKSAGYYDQAVALGMEGSKKGAEKARAAMAQKGN